MHAMEERSAETTGLWDPERWMGAEDETLTEILGVLAHEFRNPLASLQGCAQTLVQRGEDLAPDVRRGLAEVIANQSVRMDWLIRAAAAWGGLPATHRGEVDLAGVLQEAGGFAEVAVDTTGAGRIVACEAGIRMAAEAVFLAFSGQVRSARVRPPGNVLEVWVRGADLHQGGRMWKLGLAARLLRSGGGSLDMARSDGGTCVTLRFS